MAQTYQLNRRFVIQNIAALFSGSALAQGLTAVIFLIMARQLGSEVYGKFTASLALTSITALVFNLGLDLWLLQAAGKKPGNVNKLIGSVLGIKIGFSVLWFILLLIIQPFLNPETFPPQVLLWTAVAVWLDSLFMTILTAFKGTMQNRYPMILEPASDLIWLLATLYLISTNTVDIVPYIQFRVLILLVSLLVAAISFFGKFGILINRDVANEALRESPPYAFSAVLATTTLRMDLLIIAFFLGNEAAGIYSPALSMVNALFFIPLSVSNVMIPLLSHLYKQYPQQARKTSYRQLLLQIGIGISLSTLLFIFAPLIVNFLGESYQNSLQLMKILSFVLLLKPISFAFASILVATGNQTKRVFVQFIAAGLTVALDLIAVMFFTLNAVAVVYAVVELFLAIGYGLLARSIMRQFPQINPSAVIQPNQGSADR